MAARAEADGRRPAPTPTGATGACTPAPRGAPSSGPWPPGRPPPPPWPWRCPCAPCGGRSRAGGRPWFAALPAAAAAGGLGGRGRRGRARPGGRGRPSCWRPASRPARCFRGALAASFGYVDAIVRSLRDTRGADAFAAWGGWRPFLTAYLAGVWRGALLLGAPAAALWAWWDGLRVRARQEVPLDPKEAHAEAPAIPAAVHRKAAAGAVEHEAPGRVLRALTRRVPGHPPDGVSVGWTADGRPFGLADATMNRGALVSGTNGSGKTNLLELLLFDAAARGRPALLVDFKGSEALIARVERLGGVVWAFDRPSPRWNPTQGNASEVAAKVTAVEGTQTGNQWNTVTAGYVQLAVRALLDAGVATDPAAIAALLNPPELERFLRAQARAGRLTPERAGALRHELALATDKDAGFDVRPLGGVASRMRGVLHGAAADWLGQPGPGRAVPRRAGGGQGRADRAVLDQRQPLRPARPAPRGLGAGRGDAGQRLPRLGLGRRQPLPAPDRRVLQPGGVRRGDHARCWPWPGRAAWPPSCSPRASPACGRSWARAGPGRWPTPWATATSRPSSATRSRPTRRSGACAWATSTAPSTPGRSTPRRGRRRGTPGRSGRRCPTPRPAPWPRCPTTTPSSSGPATPARRSSGWPGRCPRRPRRRRRCPVWDEAVVRWPELARGTPRPPRHPPKPAPAPLPRWPRQRPSAGAGGRRTDRRPGIAPGTGGGGNSRGNSRPAHGYDRSGGRPS